METVSVDIETLNRILKNKQTLYNILTQQHGFYLPDISDRAVTDKYILSVASGEVFTIKRENVKIPFPPKKRLSVAELIDEVGKVVEGKPLGFDVLTPPSKAWLINILYSLKADHDLFVGPKDIIKRTLPERFFLFYIYYLFIFILSVFGRILTCLSFQKKGEGFLKKLIKKRMIRN